MPLKMVMALVLGPLICTKSVGSADLMPGWPIPIATQYTSAPPVTVADINGDGLPEIILGTLFEGIQIYQVDGTSLPGWPYSHPNGSGPIGQVLVGDVDGDDDPDVIYMQGVGLDEVFALNADGELKPGFPIVLDQGQTSPYMMALADLDGDGAEEIILPETPSTQPYLIQAFHGDGSVVEGWPVTLELPPPFPGTEYSSEIYLSGLATGDLEYDGTDEVVLVYLPYDPMNNPLASPIWVIEGDGCIRDGWPILPYFGGDLDYPIIVDLEGDAEPEIVLPGRGRIYAYEADGSIAYPTKPYGAWNRNACADLYGNGTRQIVLAGSRLRLFDMANNVLLAESPEQPYRLFRAAVVGDVNGDGVAEIAVWSLLTNGQFETTLHLLDLELQELPGWPQVFPGTSSPSGSQYTLALADLDGDGDAEIVHTHGLELYVWDEPKPGPEPLRIEWGMVGHDARKGFSYHELNPPAPMFLRGDGNRDGVVDVSDPVATLYFLFLGASSDCPAEMDVDVDGAVTTSDVMAGLDYLFLLGPPPAAPFPECGAEPAGEIVPCSEFFCP